ncbi:MAG: hypothetical protein HQM12_04640 [SAR324 cluster bacterium]|nr:hypothetical protein [SAR324 cluster bacterium]
MSLTRKHWKTTPSKNIEKKIKVQLKNKGSQAHNRGRKRPKYQAPQPEHSKTLQNLENFRIQANRLKGTNASLRRKSAAYRRSTNTYAKNTTRLQQRLDLHGIFLNFMRTHFTTKQVPAVAMGILEKALTFKDFFTIRYASN